MSKQQFNYTPSGAYNASEPDQQDEVNTALDLERRVLGSLMTDPECAALAPRLRASFFDGMHAEVAQAILDLVARYGIAEAAMVAELLRDRKQMDADRSVYVEQLVLAPDESGLASVYAPMWAEKIIERAQKRARLNAAATYASAIHQGDPDAWAKFEKHKAEIDAYLDQHSQLKPFKTIMDVFDLPPLDWVIYGILPAKSTAALVADGGVGKSFLALDWALRIAAGIDWQGRKIQQGHVYYMVGEGVGDIRYRIQAWCQHHNIEPSDLLPFFHWDDEATPLLRPDAVNLWLKRLATIPAPLRLVVIDTLSCVTEGANLNEPQTMSLAVLAAKKARDVTGATALILHHTNANGGIRGSTALRDDVDCCLILMEDADKVMTLTSERKCGGKMKYAEDFTPIALKREKLWLDEQLITSSCVIVSTVAEVQSSVLNGNDLKMLSALCSKFGEKPSATNAEWCAISGVPKGSQQRTINRLERGGYVGKQGTYYHPTEKGITQYHPVSNQYHDTDDMGEKEVSSSITPLRGDTSDTNFTQHPIHTNAPYQVASTAAVLDAPHSEPSYQPVVASPSMFPPSAKHVTPINEYRRQPALRTPLPDAWQTDLAHRPIGRLCDCGDLARHWEVDESRGRWACKACGSPDATMKGA